MVFDQALDLFSLYRCPIDKHNISPLFFETNKCVCAIDRGVGLGSISNGEAADIAKL